MIKNNLQRKEKTVPFFRYTKIQSESVPEPDEIVNVVEEVYLARQINLEVDSDEVQELLDSHIQELVIVELIEMHEQEQDIQKLESSGTGQPQKIEQPLGI
ncbi:hypothetical protein TNCV_4810531 [Trichonephila clavipes]|nr:hypothetical protein TNCV_4810531 [Trichonephila clavipes]